MRILFLADKMASPIFLQKKVNKQNVICYNFAVCYNFAKRLKA